MRWPGPVLAPFVVAVVALAACGPSTAPDEESGCEAGEAVVEAVGLSDADTLIAVDNGEGRLEATLDVRLDGVSETTELTSLRATIVGVPRPPSNPVPGDDGQSCLAQGGAYLCNGLYRCTDEECRFVIAEANVAPLEPSCGDDHALHVDGISLKLTDLVPSAELQGYDVELSVALETAAGQFHTNVIQLTLDVE